MTSNSMYFQLLSEMGSPAISIEKLFQLEDEDEVPPEPLYAGLTASCLRKTIINLAKVATLNAPIKHRAAVIIQSSYRGWRTRVKIRHWHRAAIKIQKTWRGYLGRCRYFRILESRLITHMLVYYNRSATIIQALFRGYYSRKYRHNQLKLRQLRLESAAQLIQCVAIKTRELLKNQQLPGVYSLRNSSCLSKVEKLMASLRIRTYNEEIKRIRAEEVKKLQKAFEKSLKSRERTELPFGLTCDKVKRKKNFGGAGPLGGGDEQIVVPHIQLAKRMKEPSEVSHSRSSDVSNLSWSLYQRRVKGGGE